MPTKKPTVLVILDGFGSAPASNGNAISLARTPILDALYAQYNHTLLQASGSAVGLPEGVVGNSEAGHVTLGSGRIVLQPLTILNEKIATHILEENPLLLDAFRRIKKSNRPLHILGILSDGNVHGNANHFYAFIHAALKANIASIICHPIIDGRDTTPQSGIYFLNDLYNYTKTTEHVILGSIHGRFYAMDRAGNWDRTDATIAILTNQNQSIQNWRHIISNAYQQNISDEFIQPFSCVAHSTLQPGDTVIITNTRPERVKQLIKKLNDAHITCITPFFNEGINAIGLYKRPIITNTLKEILNNRKNRICTIAETEKIAHVTYFFDGEKNIDLENETIIQIPSLPFQNYAEHPEMSAAQITQTAIRATETGAYDFYLINYANADMVGHSGNIPATIKAIEYLDEQIGVLLDVMVKRQKGAMYIVGDHGNAEKMLDPITNKPIHAHSLNPVPFIAIEQSNKDDSLNNLRGLSDVMNYILKSTIRKRDT